MGHRLCNILVFTSAMNRMESENFSSNKENEIKSSWAQSCHANKRFVHVIARELQQLNAVFVWRYEKKNCNFFCKTSVKENLGMKLQIEMQNEPEREGTFNQETNFLLKILLDN